MCTFSAAAKYFWARWHFWRADSEYICEGSRLRPDFEPQSQGDNHEDQDKRESRLGQSAASDSPRLSQNRSRQRPKRALLRSDPSVPIKRTSLYDRIEAAVCDEPRAPSG